MHLRVSVSATIQLQSHDVTGEKRKLRRHRGGLLLLLLVLVVRLFRELICG